MSLSNVQTVPMADDRDAARLCGYLALTPVSPFRFPFPPGADSLVQPVALGYVDGPAVRGVRVVVPGAVPRYVFRGVTRHGRTRLTVEAPIAAATDSAGLRLLDSLAAALEPEAPTDGTRLTAALPDTLLEPDLAVPDIQTLPESRLRLDEACPVATVGTEALARVDRIFRIDVPAGRTLHVRARGSAHGLVLAIDGPATPDSARTLVRWSVTDSVAVDEARQVTVRVKTVPKARDPRSTSFVLLSFALR